MAKKKTKANFSNLIGLPMKFDLSENARQGERILLASGTPTRNRDWFSGKMLRFVPTGVRTQAWQSQGGLVLYMHDFNLPLAKSSVYLENGMLWAPDKLQFHRRVIPVPAKILSSTPGTFDTGVLADLWEQKFLNSVSIHIILNKGDEPNIEETDEEIVFHTSEMIEYSIVTVPGDRESHRQNYQFMLGRGVSEDVAQCLSCYVPDGSQFAFNMMEAKQMDDELEVEEGEEFEEEEVEEEESEADGDEVELAVSVESVVNALATNPDFINGLVQAVISNPQSLALLANAVSGQVPQQRKFVLRVTSDGTPATPPAQPAPLTFSAQQPLQAPRKVRPTKETAKPNGRPSVINLVR